MVYTERDLLAVIELQKERSSFTYEELFRALTEHPSHAVYVELKGSLYGIITLGRIKRAYRNHLEQVGINTQFTAIGPDDYMKARKIFMNERLSLEREKSIHLLPVLTVEGKLLGNYTQTDALPVIEHAMPLLRNLNVKGFLERGLRLVLVRPQKDFQKEQRLFQKLKETLEEKGIFAEVIEFSQVLEYSGAVDYMLFCTMEERFTAESLCECFSAHDMACASFVDFREFIAAVCDDRSKILEYYQEQGVHVLTFGFEENEAGDLKRLENELISRRRQKDKNPGHDLRPEERKEFLLDLWEQFENQEVPFRFSTRIMPDGVIQLRDKNTPFYHIEQGHRLTVEQPDKYERCVYMFGPCSVIGAYVDDQNTLPSLLQKKINCAGLKCRVENYGAEAKELANMLLKISPKRGDVILLDKYEEGPKLRGSKIRNINLTDSLKSCPSTWFVNMVRHCNHKATQVFADVVYEAILPVLQQPAGNRQPIEKDEDPVKQFYLQRYFADFDASAYESVGSIVMNCNPFIFGHRYLIEEALKQVDFLLIFVVEEDRSLFTFRERFATVCAGTVDLERVMVVPSGDFILSSMTFPEYFIKVTDEELKENTESDIILFAEKIAPELGITHRFVGEEPDDEVTNAYNQTMKRILPLYGIQVVEIPRKRTEQNVISASRVRQCLEERELERIDTLVPDSTKKILFYSQFDFVFPIQSGE